MLNIKPKAPQLNAYIKTHKDNQPIRPVINNIQTPSYKIARFINKRLKNLLNLPHTYNVENSQQVAQELLKLRTTNKMRFITLDIKDLYVNLPVSGITHTTQFCLQMHNNNNKQLNDQILNIIETIIKQIYFQHGNEIYQQEKGIAMGSPISSTIAEIYLQYLENVYIKHWLDSKEILFYKRYVDDILIFRLRNFLLNFTTPCI